DAGAAIVFWRSPVRGCLRCRARPLRRHRRGHRRDRHRAVLRSGAALVRGPLGGGALPHGAPADRLFARIDASGHTRDLARPHAPRALAPAAGEIALAVVGAHLAGMPLNGELRSLGAQLLETSATAPDYRLYALAGIQPPKPGLLRVAAGEGAAIELEIWALS